LLSLSPFVSKTIADLEHTLGVRLLDRSRKGIEVTPYGRALLNRGVAAFDELRQGVREIEFLSDPTVGEVRIAGTPPMVLGLLPVVIDRLRRQHPRLSFQVTETSSGPTFYDQLRQRAIDFVIGRLPIRKLEKDLNGEIVFDDSICVGVGTRNRWASRRKIELADLSKNLGYCRYPILFPERLSPTCSTLADWTFREQPSLPSASRRPASCWRPEIFSPRCLGRSSDLAASDCHSRFCQSNSWLPTGRWPL
jgi:DNA-binding transcriptional LysR family regulator